jgi:hypothetical protein
VSQFINPSITATMDVQVLASQTSVSELSLALSTPSTSITVGTNSVSADATVLDNTGAAAVGVDVAFQIVGTGDFNGVKTVTVPTNGSGIASVTLYAPNLVGSAQILASVAGLSANVNVTYIPDIPWTVTLTANPSSLGVSSDSSLVATLYDQYGNVTPNEPVTFSISAAGSVTPVLSNPTGNAQTNASGVASMTYTSGAAIGTGTDTVKAVAVNGYTNGGTQPAPNATTDITVTTGSTTIGSLTMAPVNTSIVADGVTTTVVRATVKDTSGAAMNGVTVAFATSAGALSFATANTDASGVAQVSLTSTTTLARAVVTADTGGFNATATVDFVAGPAVAAKSSLTVSPSVLPADGTSTATVTVTLADTNGNPVTDGTTVTVLGIASDAVLTPTSVSTTTAGRAIYSLKAATAAATDTLYLQETTGITGAVTYGGTGGTGEPASIQVVSASNHISVAGVGQTENTTITITVLDDAGVKIVDPAADNLRVTLLTRPNGGEYISGVNFAGSTVTSAGTNTIDVVTSAGQAVLNLQSGTLPGIVEIKVETLTYVVNPTATAPQIVIASGPAHAINFTYPLTNAIINVGIGNYARKGSVVVSDRYGNAVVDGTIVNLGMIDTVIASGVDGDTATDAGALTSVATDLSTASVTRNGISRLIAANDRVLLFDAVASDKSRFAASAATGANTLPVQTPYTGAETGRAYVVGATELGATVAGVDGSGNLTPGLVTTANGIGEIRITYPANVETILTGCGLAVPDARTIPADSGDIYVVGSVSDTDATTITSKFCLSAIAGSTLSPQPDTISSTETVNLALADGGDGIPLPYVPVTTFVTITKNDSGTLTVDATTAGCANTDITGSCTATITVGGGATGDAATVTFYALDASATVSVVIP